MLLCLSSVDFWVLEEAVDLAGDVTGRFSDASPAAAPPQPHRLTPRSIRRAVARAAESVGIEGASGHSLRVGAAVSLVRSGAQTLEVQQVGRWKDQRMPAHYARHEAAARNAVARYRYGQ